MYQPCNLGNIWPQCGYIIYTSWGGKHLTTSTCVLMLWDHLAFMSFQLDWKYDKLQWCIWRGALGRYWRKLLVDLGLNLSRFCAWQYPLISNSYFAVRHLVDIPYKEEDESMEIGRWKKSMPPPPCWFVFGCLFFVSVLRFVGVGDDIRSCRFSQMMEQRLENVFSEAQAKVLNAHSRLSVQVR